MNVRGRNSAVHLLRAGTTGPSPEVQQREEQGHTFSQTLRKHLPESSWDIASESVELLNRYPDLTPIEIERLIGMFPRIPMLQVALMSADEELAPKLEKFQQDCGRKIRTPMWQIVGLMMPLALMLGLIFWLAI